MKKIKVLPHYPSNSEMGKLLEAFVNYSYQEHKEFIDAVTVARFTIENMYGHQTVDGIWERIIQAYMKKVDEVKLK